MSKVPSRGVDQFVLRFPNGIRERIREEAEQNGRSMNSEILDRLEASLEARETIQQLREEVSRLEGMNEALGRTVKAFVDHLSLTEEGKKLVLEKILEDEFARTPAKES